MQAIEFSEIPKLISVKGPEYEAIKPCRGVGEGSLAPLLPCHIQI